MQIGLARSPTERAFIFQADRAWNAARSSRIRSFGADGNPTTATLCFHYCHLMVQISIVQALRERRSPLRFVGKNKMGFYPLPLSEAHRIRKFIQFPGTSSSALDPCVGDGAAFEVITNGAEVFRYGIELDAYRAEQARQRIPNIVQGNTLEVQCPVECFGLQLFESSLRLDTGAS